MSNQPRVPKGTVESTVTPDHYSDDLVHVCFEEISTNFLLSGRVRRSKCDCKAFARHGEQGKLEENCQRSHRGMKLSVKRRRRHGHGMEEYKPNLLYHWHAFTRSGIPESPICRTILVRTLPNGMVDELDLKTSDNERKEAAF